MATRLSDAIEEYQSSRKGEGVALNTLRNNRKDLIKFLTVVGNIYTTSIEPRHVDMLFADASRTMGDATMNNVLVSLSSFFRWCRLRGYIRRDVDPLAGRKPRRVRRADRNRVPLGDFPALLDACAHPRDRMVVALGVYLFLRQSEIAGLRVRDLDLDSLELRVEITKTKDLDYMPISAELAREARAWLTYYTAQCGPLSPDWFLVPAKRAFQPVHDASGKFVRNVEADRLLPTRQMTKVESAAQRALTGIGFPLRRPDGKSAREGIHTLRRSGARALFDELSAAGYDGALRRVQAMLHHESSTMTERYLGIDLDRRQRDVAIKGMPLFPSLAAPNVVVLRHDGAEAARV